MAPMPKLDVTVYVAPYKPLPAPAQPRHFETVEAAIWFAFWSAMRKRRKFVVRRETGLRGLAVWAVRPKADDE